MNRVNQSDKEYYDTNSHFDNDYQNQHSASIFLFNPDVAKAKINGSTPYQ